MLEKVLKFQVVTKGEKIHNIKPLLPTIKFNLSEKQNNYTEMMDHQQSMNRYSGTYRSNSQKRNQIKSIRRSKGVGYSQLIDNYKNTSRQSQENPFQTELLIKQFQSIRTKEQPSERQNTMMDCPPLKFHTIEATPKNIRYKSQPKKPEHVDTEMKITPYVHQNKRYQCVDYYYIV
ncbi:unnamed protein product (macronuclear) [Paramecium tetraurelia]|uniref:Uncharacterized protein n=1 Tax=Paramecium tetraurelia TaxID=5888 RepID=A0CIY5_PARTE|nr:uncharacterized protein GSPATT00007887001 [Paramecium tetraurelia]CAK70752.1 unnamed protein product [Paramecium tetraurelia]|eukprot:XP_001438149.1 hypothetical protein (macronuclear) [Paramecium tetraurelia strain d4-2]